jgi:hypothetical protein
LVSLRATLHDAAAQRELREEGYVVLDLLAPPELRALQAVSEELHARPGAGWESDFYSPDPQVKRRVHEEIGRALAPGVARHFVDHRTLLHNFVINWPGDDGGLVLHQHSSLVDERRFRSVIAWCAVNPATEENGTLHVVPRSHRLQQGPRPERSGSWLNEHRARLLRDHLVSVPVEPGQALIFDNQLLHCSFPNRTGSPRITAAAAIIPSAATPRFYESLGESRVRIHRLDPEFFFEHVAGDLEWASPEGLEVLGEEPWAPTEVAERDLLRLIPHGTCHHEA